MFTSQDLQQLSKKGITTSQVESQLQDFVKGFPFLKLKGAAAVGNGIQAPNAEEQEAAIAAWQAYKQQGHRITKFVPASGAASRMFKNLFEFLDGANTTPQTDFEKVFFAHIHAFAFYAELDAACGKLYGKGIDALVTGGQYKEVVAALLNGEGLNYGQLPKGLLTFHKYDALTRTPV